MYEPLIIWAEVQKFFKTPMPRERHATCSKDSFNLKLNDANTLLIGEII